MLLLAIKRNLKCLQYQEHHHICSTVSVDSTGTKLVGKDRFYLRAFSKTPIMIRVKLGFLRRQSPGEAGSLCRSWRWRSAGEHNKELMRKKWGKKQGGRSTEAEITTKSSVSNGTERPSAVQRQKWQQSYRDEWKGVRSFNLPDAAQLNGISLPQPFGSLNYLPAKCEIRQLWREIYRR